MGFILGILLTKYIDSIDLFADLNYGQVLHQEFIPSEM